MGRDGWGAAALARAQEGAPGKKRRRREAQLWIKPHSSPRASDEARCL